MVKRVLVTGGTGVIGAYVVREFVDRGVTPIVFVRGQTDSIGRAINGDVDDRLIWAYGDVLDQASLQRALAEHGAEAIVHMASAKPWQIEPPFVPELNVRAGLEQIALGTANVLEAARQAGIRRVVYASSKGVYGDIEGRYSAPAWEPLPTDYPQNPRMLYGIGKVAAEHLGVYYAREYGIEWAAIRFSSSYGPLKRGPKDTSPDGLFVTALEEGAVRVRTFRPGDCDDFAYNRDVATSFVLAALAPNKPARLAYNIGSGKGSTHEHIVRGLLHVLPNTKVEYLEPTAASVGTSIIDKARCVMDITPAAEDFGYQPRYASFEAAFADFLAEEQRIRAAREAVAR